MQKKDLKDYKKEVLNNVVLKDKSTVYPRVKIEFSAKYEGHRNMPVRSESIIEPSKSKINVIGRGIDLVDIRRSILFKNYTPELLQKKINEVEGIIQDQEDASRKRALILEKVRSELIQIVIKSNIDICRNTRFEIRKGQFWIETPTTKYVCKWMSSGNESTRLFIERIIYRTPKNIEDVKN